MASLSELVDASLTVDAVVIRLQQILHDLAHEVHMEPFHDEELTLYSFYLQRVLQRNAKMLEPK